jgi:hypothetical protein
MELPILLTWLSKPQRIVSDKECKFLMTSLRSALLKDLNNSVNPEGKTEETKKLSWSNKAKLALLGTAGVLYFGCQGFGITSILSIFSFIPNIAFFVIGTLFSLFAVVGFYNFSLHGISKKMGIKFHDAPELLDVLLDEFKQIKALRAYLNQDKKQTTLEEDMAIATMLFKRNEALNSSRKELKNALKNPYLKLGKTLVAAGAGMLMFSGGYFSGQSVALALAHLCMASALPTSWPIILVSIVIGLSAFCVYWFMERPVIENLIGRWKGLDKEKIHALCDEKVVSKEQNKLRTLIQGFKNKIELHQDNEALREQISRLESEKQPVHHPSPLASTQKVSRVTVNADTANNTPAIISTT